MDGEEGRFFGDVRLRVAGVEGSELPADVALRSEAGHVEHGVRLEVHRSRAIGNDVVLVIAIRQVNAIGLLQIPQFSSELTPKSSFGVSVPT